MYDIDPDALAENNLRRRKTKGNFTSRGPNWVHSLDGHDKLIGYQNSTLPIAVYGCIDTCSQKMFWAKFCVYLYKARTTASKLRLDKGSETVSFNVLLSRQHNGDMLMDAVKTVMYGPSSSNQVCVLFLCDAVFFSHQSTWILALNICRNVLPFDLVIKNWNSIRT